MRRNLIHLTLLAAAATFVVAVQRDTPIRQWLVPSAIGNESQAAVVVRAYDVNDLLPPPGEGPPAYTAKEAAEINYRVCFSSIKAGERPPTYREVMSDDLLGLVINGLLALPVPEDDSLTAPPEYARMVGGRLVVTARESQQRRVDTVLSALRANGGPLLTWQQLHGRGDPGETTPQIAMP